MNLNTLAAAYVKITDLTNKGLIEWEHVDENSYNVSFSRSTLEIQADQNYTPALHHLDVRNEDGIIIGYVAAEQISEPEYGGETLVHLQQEVEPLFRTVEEQVLKAEATTESLMADLELVESQADRPQAATGARVETLNTEEIRMLLEPLAGSGGFQSLAKKLRGQYDAQTRTIKLDTDDLRRIPEYAFDAGQGGFQERLQKIFGRVLGPKLGR